MSEKVNLLVWGAGLILAGLALYGLFALARYNIYMDSPADFSASPAQIERDTPTLSLADASGVLRSLSADPGQVVLVNLWATWCAPCKAELPNLQNFYARHQGEGFRVVAIEEGDPQVDVIAFVHDYHLTFSVWMDPTYQASEQAFKTKYLPSSYVIDRRGEMRLEWFGAISEQNLEKYVIPLIKEP